MSDDKIARMERELRLLPGAIARAKKAPIRVKYTTGSKSSPTAFCSRKGGKSD